MSSEFLRRVSDDTRSRIGLMLMVVTRQGALAPQDVHVPRVPELDVPVETPVALVPGEPELVWAIRTPLAKVRA